ncbi:MAG: DHHA1 domain-containing protein, partial [Desulfonatronovibrionaceae bacterium]
REALRFWRENRSRLESIQAMLKAGPEQIEEKVAGLQEQLRQALRENRTLKEKLSSGAGNQIAASAEDVAGMKVVAHNAEDADMNSLRKLMDDIRSRITSGAAMLASVHKGKPLLLLYVSQDLHEKFTAPELIKKAAAEIRGSGGGRPDLAQAGGADSSGVDRALERFKEEIARKS